MNKNILKHAKYLNENINLSYSKSFKYAYQFDNLKKIINNFFLETDSFDEEKSIFYTNMIYDSIITETENDKNLSKEELIKIQKDQKYQNKIHIINTTAGIIGKISGTALANK
jgi:hypothetical protein